MVDFLICYEHIAREVENDALIKYELERRGYTCEIIPFNGEGYFRYSIKNKARVIVTPWLRYDENVFHYINMAARPYKLVNLQWEQVYSMDDLKSGMAVTSYQAKKAFHLCWGENSKERLISEGVDEKNIFVTGAIQLDYGRSIFAYYYLDRESIALEFKLDPLKKWILFISSFAYVSYGDGALRQLEEQFSCSLDEQVKLHINSQSIILDWIERLLFETDCEFIYRPHPSENVDDRLKSMESRYPNFHVIPNYSVKQWAKISDKVNIWMSTSNAELSAMGVDYAIVRPIPVKFDLEVESMREESFITNYGDFFCYNSLISNRVSVLPAERIKKLSSYYSYDEDVPSYVRTADCLELILKYSQGANFHFTLKQRIIFTWREIKKLLISFIIELYQIRRFQKILDVLPLKQIIKNNIKTNSEKYIKAKEIEKATLKYMKVVNY